jgi:hypothetical protein
MITSFIIHYLGAPKRPGIAKRGLISRQVNARYGIDPSVVFPRGSF